MVNANAIKNHERKQNIQLYCEFLEALMILNK